jgi:hypothetical protein
MDHDVGVREREALALGAGARMIEPAEAAMPTQTVETSGFTWFIASTMARPRVT